MKPPRLRMRDDGGILVDGPPLLSTPVLIVLLGATTLPAVVMLNDGAPIWAAGLVSALSATLLLACGSVGYRFQAETIHRRTWLQRRLCPACEYNLADLTADEGGLTTCPECGAAWRMPGP